MHNSVPEVDWLSTFLQTLQEWYFFEYLAKHFYLLSATIAPLLADFDPFDRYVLCLLSGDLSRSFCFDLRAIYDRFIILRFLESWYYSQSFFCAATNPFNSVLKIEKKSRGHIFLEAKMTRMPAMPVNAGYTTTRSWSSEQNTKWVVGCDTTLDPTYDALATTRGVDDRRDRRDGFEPAA